MAYTLSQLVDRAVFMSMEAQLLLEDRVKNLSWQAELDSDTPTLTFGEGQRIIETRPSFLGTVAVKELSWHWGWDNIYHLPEALIELARQVKVYSEGTPELVTVELPLDEDKKLPLKLTLAAKALTGVWTHYIASAGPATDVWFLIEGPDLELGEPSVARIGGVLMQALITIGITDHRRALLDYAQLRGLAHHEDADSVTLFAPNGSARVELSEGRIANISISTKDEQQREETAEPAATPEPMSEPAVDPEPEPEKKGLFSRIFGGR